MSNGRVTPPGQLDVRCRGTRRLIGAAAAMALVLMFAGCTSTHPPHNEADASTPDSGIDLADIQAGWGPPRKLFSVKDQVSEAVFNSITDDPEIGDERRFLQLHEVGAKGGIRDQDFALQPGRTYEGYVNFHNNASAASPDQTSYDSRISVQLPATVSGRERASAIIRSGTADPPAIWRSLVLTVPADSPVAIRIVPGAAMMYTGRIPSGVPIAEGDLFSDRGALVGCAKLDGSVPGGKECRGFVRFRFVTDQPNFSLAQRVAVSGGRDWGHVSNFQAGQKVDYKINYFNSGTTQQNDVVIKVELRDGLTFVKGSTKIATSNTGNRWSPVEHDNLITRGINIGSYAPGGNANLKFTAQLPTNGSLECGFQSATNVARAETNNGTKSSELTIWIEKVC